jgi:hypothetical protein
MDDLHSNNSNNSNPETLAELSPRFALFLRLLSSSYDMTLHFK